MPTIRSRSLSAAAALALAATLAAPSAALAQDDPRDSGYRLPPREIVDILDAPPTPAVSVSPDGTTIILVERESLPPIAEMARPMERLAGRRLDPQNNGPHGPRRYVGLTLQNLESGEQTEVRTPAGTGIGYPSWSPDGSKFAFTATRSDGVQLYIGDSETGRVRSITGWDVNLAAGGIDWLPDNRRIVAHLVPDRRDDMPERSVVPTGPVSQESAGRTSPVRTYQDLLEDEHDEAMFDWLMTSQIAVIDTKTRREKKVGDPAVYGSVTPSPDGEYLLVNRINRPYSYLVPLWSFPETTEVWTIDGDMVAEIADLPLQDTVPIGGVPTGRRSISWQANAPASLVWVEALDGGDPKAEAEHRDKVMTLNAPFTGQPKQFVKLEDRFSGVTYIDGGRQALAREYDRDSRVARTWLVDFSQTRAEPRLVEERNIQDRYADPGTPVTTRNEFGRRVALVDGDSIFMRGRGATPKGDRPFLHKMSLQSFDKTELWRNAGDNYETVVDLLPGMRVLTSYETTTTPPNYYVRDLARGTREQITDFPNPHPQLTGIKKELVTYDRGDDVTLSATLYLPPDYREGQELPLVVWAYPREFNDARTAGQIAGSPHRFTRIGGYSHLFFLTQGYAVMDGATMPVIGDDPETVNDTFIEQIVAAGDAAVRFAAERGVADADRAAVGGHSYGAFMTAHLLAASDTFRAGIARSGAYNRTLTPFGFQSERRTFWQAPDVYFELSPFMHADEINEPVLLTHGMIDNNSGTFPMQSERMYHAIKGHGGTVRLVMLPYESHGYRARESVMHVLAEMIDWLDEHVKYAEARGGDARYEAGEED